MMGGLGIFAGHMPLLTRLKPGQLRAVLSNGAEHLFYISGGMLEVQPEMAIVLADTATRAEDLDEAAAVAAKGEGERELVDQKAGIDYSRALTELAEALAQLRTLDALRHKTRH